jgi:hypothetical protein
VSGSDAAEARVGLVLRSEDGGATFSAARHALPAGTGSLWISAVHPTEPDRLWLRVSARGDSLGLLPARLYTSADEGESMQMLAETNKGMFGFALSPDGARLAYGGPNDGLFVGNADGSGGFEKRSSLGVRCLRWLPSGTLYACGSEPADPFSVGVSDDEGASFQPLFRLSDTCPASCASGTSFAASCEQAWAPTRMLLASSMAAPMCGAPWDAPAPASARPEDAGSTSPPMMGSMDASAGVLGVDASNRPTQRADDGGCAVAHESADASLLALLMSFSCLYRRRAQERRA